ncbi:S-adenosyl-L-methionine-dependent methyltransferase [Mycena crocata]|nr:S-adenosyl-L-methionine-dependent methyltransferase [Mycena crocata]
MTPPSTLIQLSKLIAESVAALQLAALTMPPKEVLLEVMHGPHLAAALRVSIEANVPDILREAGPAGLDAHLIAAKSHIDGNKLARIMRYLSSHHIYREVNPDTFANNRLSAVLATEKPVTELFSNPGDKHENTSGFAAYATFMLDLGSKSTCYLWETVSDPAVASSYKVVDSSFHRMLGIDVPVWKFWEQPEQKQIRRLFGIGLKGSGATYPEGVILEAFPWAELPNGAVVVDVGGGVGWASLVLARKNPHLRIVIQEQAEVVQQSIKMWKQELPGAVESGQVRVCVHDFFQPQPVQDAAVFFLRFIIHDWPDADARNILMQLRRAATPQTTLVLLDHVVPYACPQPDMNVEGSESESFAVAPYPLLPNYGAANALAYASDMRMLVVLNSQERKITDLDRLLASVGWRLRRIVRIEATSSFFQPIQAVPRVV